jgi:hypothetical protein
MIMYLAAVASAITLTITPVVVSEQEPAKKEVQWKKPQNATTVTIQIPIEISGAVAAYVLTPREQNIFRRALLRSVKVIDRGRLA